ncbi:hypothetical protein GMPD_16750 [Geomonas paludis]|uniref:Uncharacterized protein n=1 Tax=Geomonas paludis TaxID=2740185 RepID=A0A6V8MU96_9BACT|nr:hypothetical protein GMPD_16750 [Geomonas paludis]
MVPEKGRQKERQKGQAPPGACPFSGTLLSAQVSFSRHKGDRHLSEPVPVKHKGDRHLAEPVPVKHKGDRHLAEPVPLTEEAEWT